MNSSQVNSFLEHSQNERLKSVSLVIMVIRLHIKINTTYQHVNIVAYNCYEINHDCHIVAFQSVMACIHERTIAFPSLKVNKREAI